MKIKLMAGKKVIYETTVGDTIRMIDMSNIQLMENIKYSIAELSKRANMKYGYHKEKR